MQKQLLVNGYGMTWLTPITKMMAHLPLAFLDRSPQDALVICFGMGTTFRSLHSWGIPVTAVELVPSVPRLMILKIRVKNDELVLKKKKKLFSYTTAMPAILSSPFVSKCIINYYYI